MGIHGTRHVPCSKEDLTPCAVRLGRPMLRVTLWIAGCISARRNGDTEAMVDSLTQAAALERVPTGIPGLDVILRGGFFRGGIYLILGSPGTGKTILGNQMSFHHVAQGGRVAYVTLLAETHARMLSHIRSLSFFDPAPVADSLYYVSGYRVLQDAGLQGLLDLLRGMIRERRATLLILDGLTILAELMESGMLFRQFIHELQVYTEALGCTTFL